MRLGAASEKSFHSQCHIFCHFIPSLCLDDVAEWPLRYFDESWHEAGVPFAICHCLPEKSQFCFLNVEIK